MANLQMLTSLVLGVLLLDALIAEAKPNECGYPCAGLGYGGGFGGGVGYGGGCGVPISPPISFAPIPQPIPIRIPAPPRQSVTIPNIILALLPPNNKPVCQPPPIVRPRPVVVPIPQPYPLPINECCC